MNKKHYHEIIRILEQKAGEHGTAFRGEVYVPLNLVKDEILSYFKKDCEFLIYPTFVNSEFIEKFEELIQQKKQRKKTLEQKQKLLDKLAEFENDFAIEVMQQAIDNDYQGVIFQKTKNDYAKYINKKLGEVATLRADNKRIRTF